MNYSIKEISKLAIIAATYTVVTVILAPISYGSIQVRLSEALTLLPFYLGTPAAISLWLGCMLANYLGGTGIIDIIFGSLLTLIAGLFTAKSKNLYTAGIYPVLFNAFGVALILHYTVKSPYWLTVLYVAFGQFVSVYIVGIILMRLLERYDIFEKIKIRNSDQLS
ncbi:MAG: QueT transporter family protein [Halanaerobiaceae bacterium]|jgi:uncharacterized membrane protein|nr:QueT transporter family protein [Halanaerobiaceae bacterium]